jgi:hypothetical protein
MKKVSYKGQSYDYTISEKNGVKQFALFKNGVLQYSVIECDLDKRTVVSLVLENYFTKQAKGRISKLSQ